VKVAIAIMFLLVGLPVATLGLAFAFNLRGLGVRYVVWYRDNWAWTGGIKALHTPRGTRWVAAAIGLIWFVCDGGIVALAVLALWK
jgi:hypothetical protein